MQEERTSSTPHVVIVGGGFGGLNAALGLGKVPVRVTVVDRRNYHLFQPLLYQVATAALSPADVAYPIRWVVRRQKNTDVILADAVSVDVPGRRLILADGALDYDLIGFRNRIVVMFEWIWAYLTRQRGARLITYEEGMPPAPPSPPRQQAPP